MEIKILSFNIHKGKGRYLLGSNFEKIEQHIRALSPEFIFFQEIMGQQAKSIQLDLWAHYSYGMNVVYIKNHYGNAIFSKFPIIFSENFDLSTYKLEQRGLLHSVIQIANEKQIHLLCVHLGLFKKSREKQYIKIIDYIQSTIGPDEPIIFAGDFNDWGSHATIPLIDKFGLKEAFMTLHGSYPRTFPSWAPFLKLDRVYIRGFKVYQAERMTDKSWSGLSDHIALNVNLKF